MRTSAILLTAALAVAAGCGSSSAPAKSAAAKPTTTAPPTTYAVESVPTTAASATDPTLTGNILMLKLFVGDLAAAEKFYGAIFGAKLALKVGDNAHVVTFPNGGTGLILIKDGPNDKDKYGAFVIKVPDLKATETRALANGAKKQGTFTGNPNQQAARSVDLLDPWGNQFEILQLG